MKIYFKDYPEFKPNITPKEMFELGIMGGSYFRVIKSPKTKKTCFFEPTGAIYYIQKGGCYHQR